MAGLSVGANLHSAKFYEIRIGSGPITIENIWKKTSYPLDQLADIQLLRFNILLLTNRSLIFYFKDGRSLGGRYPMPLSSISSPAGYRNMLKILKHNFYTLSGDDGAVEVAAAERGWHLAEPGDRLVAGGVKH